MSPTASRDQAYEAFLSSSDLATWTASLSAYESLFDGHEEPRDARPIDVLRALTLSIYVRWLESRCGSKVPAGDTFDRFLSLHARLGRAPLHGDEGTLIEAVRAAGLGYRAVARRIVGQVGAPLPVEISLLTVNDQPTRRAEELRPFVLDGSGPRFVPALYYYGAALLDLGYQTAVSELVARHPAASQTSMVADLRGQILELSSSWEKARAAYDGSEWASHQYRLSVCDLILGAPVDELAMLPADRAAKFRAGMMDFGTETDRAGALRSASFVRACRWTGFDNWLVRFELGRLGFQRRRHAEAERHLAAAAPTTPTLYRFPVHWLRFCNLTWLGDKMDIRVLPETLEAGYAALQEPATEEERAPIRTWIASRGMDASVVEPVFTAENDYERGLAHQIRENAPDSLRCWCSAISSAFNPRAFQQLLATFASYGFERTATRLARIVADESEESFAQLLELAEGLAAVLQSAPPGLLSAGAVGEELVRIESRLELLVQSEFQNAIRAFHHFLRRSQAAPALRMLARAERLAEGPEERLLIAVGRRMSRGSGDPRARDALLLAARESSDRLERLLIARELAALGDRPGARRILEEETAFSATGNLTPLEYVLAHDCAVRCCTREELAPLGTAAIDALKRDADAGRFARYGKRFADRLSESLATAATNLISLAAPEDIPQGAVNPWREMLAQLERSASDPQEELLVLNAQVEAASGTGSPWARFALWDLHLKRFVAQLWTIDRTRPTVPEEEVPLARDGSLRRARAGQLVRLWRAQLLAADEASASARLDDIRAFLAEEQRLTTRWDQLRTEKAAGSSKLASAYAQQGATLLEAIAADGATSGLWPSFLDIGSAVVEDARELAATLKQRAASARERAA